MADIYFRGGPSRCNRIFAPGANGGSALKRLPIIDSQHSEYSLILWEYSDRVPC